MEKRLLLAASLSLLILIVYSQFVHKRYPIENKEVIKKTLLINQTSPSTLSTLSTEIKSTTTRVKTEEYIFETEKFRCVFTNPGARLAEVFLKDYQSRLIFENGFLIPEWQDYNFSVQKTASAILFSYTENGKKFLKEFNFSNDKHNIELRISVQSENASAGLAGYKLLIGHQFGMAKDAQEKSDERFWEAGLALKDRLQRHSLFNLKKDVIYAEEIIWLALRNRYYCLIIYPAAGRIQTAFLNRSAQNTVNLAWALPQNSSQQIFYIYLGPQEIEKLTTLTSVFRQNLLREHGQSAGLNLGFEQIVHFGTFDPISKLLLKILKFFVRLTHNWGVGIILLTIVVFFLLYPLTLKQMSSLKRMQALHPQIEELKRSLKDNPQKLNKEIMELYRKNKVNPLGGCLPMILQIPIFFALYQALIRMPELRGANFLWIKDLSAPDRLWTLPFSLPILGNEVNLLPILMAIGMFVQQKMSMSAQATGSQEQQKMMLILFPLMFGVMFYHLSSGLVLYWFIQNILMLVFQWRIAKAGK